MEENEVVKETNTETRNEDVCCPEFDPEPWDNKVHKWHEKRFISTKVKTFLHIPLGFGKAMTKLTSVISSAHAVFEDAMCLSEHTSMWNMNLYLAVDKYIEGAENISLSGSFYTKVYEGEFKNIGVWMEDFKKVLQEKRIVSRQMYMWYTTCPKCAKKYGQNYVVVVAKIYETY